MIDVSTTEPWTELPPDLQAILAERVERLLPGKDPAEHWREMGPKHRAEWLWHETCGDPVTDAWDQQRAEALANADPATVAALRLLVAQHEPTGLAPDPLDWTAFWSTEASDPEWVVEPIFPAGRQVAIYSSAKAGKSLLALDVVAAAVTGRSVLGAPARPRVRALYLDMEMTESDLRERLVDLGYSSRDDLSGLAYHQLPSLPPLDRELGGEVLTEMAAAHQADLVIIDTMSRVVSGEENNADTFRGFYAHTGLRLKQMGIALGRLDHEGKGAQGQRGSSAKNDDVDVVYRLTATDPTHLTLRRTHSRVPWMANEIRIARLEEQCLRHVIAQDEWPEGTAEVAKLLDELDLPLDATAATATAALKAGGSGRRKVVVLAALKLRKLRAS